MATATVSTWLDKHCHGPNRLDESADIAQAFQHAEQVMVQMEIAVCTSDPELRREKLANAIRHMIHFCDRTGLDFDELVGEAAEGYLIDTEGA